MKQLLLDLNAVPPQSLESFTPGKNTELLQRLASVERGAPQSERILYLWGQPGAGKTHLLRALANTARSRYICAGAESPEFEYSPAIRLYLLDDCHLMPEAAQAAAFNLFNQIREQQAVLVAAGAMAPAVLPLREDLRTRMGWGLIYQVHELSDDEKIAALDQAAKARGMNLPDAVLPYLITHFRRDMRSLAALLDALDRHSLETKRPITLPLLRDLLQHEETIKT